MSILLIIGPMFAGKTTELIRRIRRELSKTCIILKPSIDTRYKYEFVQTHDGTQIECEILDIDKDYSNYDVIAIDEGQFVPELKIFCEKYPTKKIIISALSGDFNRESFIPVTDIIPIATKIIHLSAVCSCGLKASFTKALENFDRITIGGSEKFAAKCGACY